MLSIHQPLYLPPLHFFNKILKCDKFILLDNVKISRSDFVHRNRILMDYKKVMLNHPIGRHKNMPIIRDMTIDPDMCSRHSDIIRQAYNKSKYYNDYSYLLDFKSSNLSKLNTHFIREVCYALDIDTEISVQSPESCSNGLSGSGLILSICLEEDASTYLSGACGSNYLKADEFKKHDIQILYQDFNYIKYKQSDRRFHTHLSILDAIFNIGPIEAKKLLIVGDNWI